MSDEARAHHEAAHALVACLRGGRVLSCSVLEDESPSAEGATVVEWPPVPDARRRAEDLCWVALAGPVGELLYRGEEVEPQTVEAWRGDWAQAWSAAGRLAEETSARWRLLGDVLRRLCSLLDREDHAQTLAQIVDHLLVEESLDEQQIEDLVDRW